MAAVTATVVEAGVAAHNLLAGDHVRHDGDHVRRDGLRRVMIAASWKRHLRGHRRQQRAPSTRPVL